MTLAQVGCAVADLRDWSEVSSGSLERLHPAMTSHVPPNPCGTRC
jgi:hypothetical protein